MKNKDIIILAAGVGSRLQPLTDTIPKSLVKVNQRSILHRLLDQLEANSEIINSVKVVVGYKKNAIVDFLKGSSFTIQIDIVDNLDYSTTNNMYSLYLALNEIKNDNDVIIINADCCYEDIVVRKMLISEKSCIAVDQTQYNLESMKVRVAREGENVIEMSKALEKDTDVMVSMDIYHFKQADKTELARVVSEVINSGDLNSWTEVAIDMMVKNTLINIGINNMSGYRWMEIDDHMDLEKANRIFA